MQNFVHNNQKHLADFLSEAEEWGRARDQAVAERQTDWELVCKTAGGSCPHGQSCTYAQAAEKFFEKNAGTLSKNALAAALRDILMYGPSKTTRPGAFDHWAK